MNAAAKAFDAIQDAADVLEYKAQSIRDSVRAVVQAHNEFDAVTVASAAFAEERGALLPKADEALQEQIALRNAGDPLQEIINLQRCAGIPYAVYLNELASIAMRYLQATRLEKLDPRRYEALTLEIYSYVENSQDQHLVGLINSNYEWLRRLRWMQLDGVVTCQISYAAWLNAGRPIRSKIRYDYHPLGKRILLSSLRMPLYCLRRFAELNTDLPPKAKPSSYF